PNTPAGLIVHDAGQPVCVGGTAAGTPCANNTPCTGGTCQVSGPSSLSFAACASGVASACSLPPSTSETATFDVTNPNQPLKAVLTWVEAQTQTLINNLDLELRYCGPDGNCATVDGICAFGVHNTHNGVACPNANPLIDNCDCTGIADPLCTVGRCQQDQVYYGNV